MKVTAVKTRVVRPPKDDLEDLLKNHLPKLHEGVIIVVASKVVAICEGACVPRASISKEELIKKEADRYIITRTKAGKNYLTQKWGQLIGAAGVDESNASDYYIVLPRQPYLSAQRIWDYVRQTQGIKRLGVVVADSNSVPKHKGAVGIGLGAYGFEPVKSYVGQPDIFGRRLQISAANLVDGLAAAGVLVMGEGSETTPIALVTELENVTFHEERISLTRARDLGIVSKPTDIYTPLLDNDLWHRS